MVELLKVGRLEVVPKGHFASPLACTERVASPSCLVSNARPLGCGKLGERVWRARLRSIARVAETG